MSKDKAILHREDLLSRIMIANPYTDEGRSTLNGLKTDVGLDLDLSIDNFFCIDGLYVPPFFDKDEVDADCIPYNDTETDKDDYNFKNDSYLDIKFDFLHEKEGFEKAIKSKAEFPLLFIQGMAGSGKSIYLYKLVSELTSNDEYIHVKYSLDAYENRPLFYGESLPFHNEKETATFSFLNLVCYDLMREVKLVLKSDKSHIENISSNYSDIFEFCPTRSNEIKDFFKLFDKCNGNVTKKEEFFEYGKEFSKTMISMMEQKNILESISEVLLCMSKLLYLRHRGKRILITFDGIEYLIKLRGNAKKYIYDADVEKILIAVLNFVDNASAIFEESDFKFAEYFKIVVCARDTTARYFRNIRLQDRMQERTRDENAFVNVTDWYSIDTIYKKRKEFYEKIKEAFDCIKQYTQLVDTIMKDTTRPEHERTNQITPMLERMYNHDKRSIQRNLFEVVSRMFTKSQTSTNRFIKFFNDRGKLTYKDKSGNDIKGFRYRYLCRRAVLRLLFNKIEQENNGEFFKKIYFSRFGEEPIQSTFMRKMLIFLMYKQVSDNRIKGNYVDIRELIQNVARPKVGADIAPKVIEGIAELLYFTSDYRLHNSAWQQLISVKFNYDKIAVVPNAKVEYFFIDTVRKIYEDDEFYGEHRDLFGVRITYAGMFLAYMQSDYIFFAYRFEPNGDKGKTLMLSSDAEDICEVIQSVYTNAIKCIVAVIENEKDLFGKYEKMYEDEQNYLYPDFVSERLLSHPKRIFNNHIMYLDHYKTFVSNVHDFFRNEEDRKRILKCIDKYVRAYKRRYNELIDGYGKLEKDNSIQDFSKSKALMDNDPAPCAYFSCNGTRYHRYTKEEL